VSPWSDHQAKKKEDANTRYYLDVDLASQTILSWDRRQRERLEQKLPTKAFYFEGPVQ